MGVDHPCLLRWVRMVGEPFEKPVGSTSWSLRWAPPHPAGPTLDPIGHHELEPLLAALANPHQRGGGFAPDRLRKLLDLM